MRASAAAQPAPPHVSERSRLNGTDRKKTRDPDEAEQIVTDTYLPNRLLRTASAEIDMELVSADLGEVTAGLLSYGRAIALRTADTSRFHVNVTLEGRGTSRSGRGDAHMTTQGQAIVFPVGEPAFVNWSAEARHLCLMATRASLETELEQLLGRSLPKPLNFEQCLRADVGDQWQPALQLLRQELENPQGLLTRPTVAGHLKGLVVGGLLLTQPHNYRDLLDHDAPPGPAGAIARAAELMEGLPGESWTVVKLAAEVHLSVRALQYGFQRDFNMPPMAYLKRVRLRHAHDALLASSPEVTTVQAVALDCGFFHMGRFAAAYRAAYDEPPSLTLARRG